MTMLPPPQFDHLPTVPVIERVLPAAEVDRFCRPYFKEAQGRSIEGCSASKDGKCFVVRIDREDVRRHELGHCNGWPREHDGAVLTPEDIQVRRDR